MYFKQIAILKVFMLSQFDYRFSQITCIFLKPLGLIHNIRGWKLMGKPLRFNLQRHEFTSVYMRVSVSFCACWHQFSCTSIICPFTPMLMSCQFFFCLENCIHVAYSCTEKNLHAIPAMWCEQDTDNNGFGCALAKHVQKNWRVCTWALGLVQTIVQRRSFLLLFL